VVLRTYKGEGDTIEGGLYRGIKLLCMPRKWLKGSLNIELDSR